MLQIIRERATGVIAWIIVILIAIPFALWGINDYFGSDVKLYAAKINDREITLQEFQRALQQQRQQLQALLGDSLNPELLDQSALKQQVLQQLIESELLLQAAIDGGLRISDMQLAAEIRAIEAFHKDGAFSGEQYQAQLLRAGLVPVEFEAQQRSAMLAQQFYSAVADTAIVSAQDIDQAVRIQRQQRDVSYLVLPVAAFSKDIEVSDQEIAQYYESNTGRFMTPEQVNIEYLELNAAGIADSIQPDEQELRQAYEESSARFTTEEQRRASHILVQVPEDADEKVLAAAREKSEKLLQRIRAGESFEELAKEFSDDKVSAAEGGDLNFFGKGVMVPPFEEAVFALEKGQVSDLVRSQFGFHIIKLTDIRPGSKKSFEEVRSELVKQVQNRKAEEEYYALADRLATLVYENPDSLEPAAEALGLEVMEGGWITRAGAEGGPAANPKVVASAFSEDVLERGLNGEPVEIAPRHLVVVRVKEHRPATRRPLDEVREDIVAELRTRAAKDKAREVGAEILKRAEAGDALDTLAAEHDVKVERPGLVERSEQGVDPAILQAAFKLQKPAQGKPTYGTTLLPSGDYAVIAVTAVQEGDPSKVPEEQRKSIARSLAQMNGVGEFAALMGRLKGQAKIVINEDRL